MRSKPGTVVFHYNSRPIIKAEYTKSTPSQSIGLYYTHPRNTAHAFDGYATKSLDPHQALGDATCISAQLTKHWRDVRHMPNPPSKNVILQTLPKSTHVPQTHLSFTRVYHTPTRHPFCVLESAMSFQTLTSST